MTIKTCPDCGERVYNLGCVNCNEPAYIEEQEQLTDLLYPSPRAKVDIPTDPTKTATPQDMAQDEPACKHGIAMDVHCCNCHSGFIFDRYHVCEPAPLDWFFNASVEDVIGALVEDGSVLSRWKDEIKRASVRAEDRVIAAEQVASVTNKHRELSRAQCDCGMEMDLSGASYDGPEVILTYICRSCDEQVVLFFHRPETQRVWPK